MFFKRSDNLTSNLTSYDFLKCITVLFMFADHVGAYFIPDEPWWRVAGRLGFPAWFFLAGYSNDKGVSPKLWLGAGILILGNVMFGTYIFPLNALASYICIRIFMTHGYPKYFSHWEPLLYSTFALILLAYSTNYIFEYGTLAFLLAMFGYSVRHQDELGIGRVIQILFAVVVAIAVSIVQITTFGFHGMLAVVCFVFLCAMCFVLYHFKRAEYPQLTQKLPRPVVAIIQFGGRYTLEIYVIHLMLIKAYLFFADTSDQFQWFMPRLME